MAINREELLNNANALDVARAIGMNVVKRGSKYFIPCPGHFKRLGRHDNKPTNAVLTPKGYHCFACDAKVGIIDMVMEYKNCSAKEAMEIIAETCGGLSLYTTKKGNKAVVKLPLSQEDLKLIGLAGGNSGASSKSLINVAIEEPDIEDGFWQKEGGEYFVYEKSNTITLNTLLAINKNKFNATVMFRAKESMDKYKKAIDVFCARDADKALVVYDVFNQEGNLDSSVFSGLRNVLMKKYSRCKEIYDEYRTLLNNPSL